MSIWMDQASRGRGASRGRRTLRHQAAAGPGDALVLAWPTRVESQAPAQNEQRHATRTMCNAMAHSLSAATATA